MREFNPFRRGCRKPIAWSLTRAIYDANGKIVDFVWLRASDLLYSGTGEPPNSLTNSLMSHLRRHLMGAFLFDAWVIAIETNRQFVMEGQFFFGERERYAKITIIPHEGGIYTEFEFFDDPLRPVLPVEDHMQNIRARCATESQRWAEVTQLADAGLALDFRGIRRREEDLNSIGKQGVLTAYMYEVCGWANQPFRQITEHDQGLDGEIPFVDADGKSLELALSVQLKSGGSHLRQLKNGHFIFRDRHGIWFDKWRRHFLPVLLIVRSADGIVRWIDVREVLRRPGNESVKQIVFEGEVFDDRTVLRLKERLVLAREQNPTYGLSF